MTGPVNIPLDPADAVAMTMSDEDPYDADCPVRGFRVMTDPAADFPAGHVVWFRLTADCANSERFGFHYLSGGFRKWTAVRPEQVLVIRHRDRDGWWCASGRGWPHWVLLRPGDIEAARDLGAEDPDVLAVLDRRERGESPWAPRAAGRAAKPSLLVPGA